MPNNVPLRDLDPRPAEAILRILACANLSCRTLDPRFLSEISHLVTKITKLKEKTIQLSELYTIERLEHGWRPVPVNKSVVFRYLCGDEAPYKNYVGWFDRADHSIQNLKKLRASIMNNDYPSGGWIVTFGDEPYIRDGQHRAAILYYLRGDHEIPILNMEFLASFREWRMKKPQSPSLKTVQGSYGQLMKVQIGLREGLRKAAEMIRMAK